MFAAWLLAACSDDRPQGPAAVDPAALDAAEVPKQLVAACHQDLTGFDRFAAKVTLPDGSVARAFGDLPFRLRVQWPDGAIQLWDRGRALGPGQDGNAHTLLDAAASARLVALYELLDAASLGPVRRATACTRTGPRTFLLQQLDATRVELELQPAALRLVRLGAVHVLEHLDTLTTHIVRRAEIAPLGRCSIRFDNIDFEWDQTIFEAESGSVPRQPQETATAGGDQQSAATNSITLGMPRRPAEPTVEPMKAQRWLCLPDPGTWSARSSAVQAHVATLRAAGQTTAGFQGLMRDGERRLLIVPFRAMDGAPPFAPPADWDVREIPSGRALVVYPPHGDFSERTKVGEAMLQNAIAALQLTATGPALAQPYLHLDEAEPDAAALAAPVVRISVLVQ